ncbi:MAG: TfuA-like protein [Polyangiaceae bacterium]|jgi:hypothetical protein
MRAIVFLGPTLPVAEAAARLDATYLPPAAQGDLYRAVMERPFAIGLVDGYFERVPAVWHKEILWAIKQGIHVFGAASMGALRAAELAPFGMRGVGRIYEAFRSGELEDDDEVAVAHGDAERGFIATSEALVNIRATLTSANGEGVIGSATRVELEKIARGLFYPDRSYARLLELAAGQGLSPTEIEALRAFLPQGRVDQKRADALDLLSAVDDCRRRGERPPPARFAFASTDAWHELVDWAERQPSAVATPDATGPEQVAAEARLSVRSWEAVAAKALNRAVAEASARFRGVADRDECVARTDQRLRALHVESTSEQSFERWLAELGLNAEEYRRSLERSVEMDWLREQYRGRMDRHIVDELRARGDYEALEVRARHKDRLLARHGLSEPTERDAGLDVAALFSWYFERRIGRPPPLDLDAYLLESGLADAAALQVEALRELLYCRLLAAEP